MSTTISRRDSFKLFSGVLLTSLMGGSVISALPNNKIMINGVISDFAKSDLPNLFGIMPQMVGNDKGLAFYLAYEQNSETQSPNREIPVISLVFKKETIDCTSMTSDNHLNALDVFVEYALKTASVEDNLDLFTFEEKLHTARYRVAVRSRRGVGNCLIMSSKNLKKYANTKGVNTSTCISSDKMPEDKLMIIYAGPAYYDKPVMMAIQTTKTTDPHTVNFIEEHLETSKKWVVCHRDDFSKYATIINI